MLNATTLGESRIVEDFDEPISERSDGDIKLPSLAVSIQQDQV